MDPKPRLPNPISPHITRESEEIVFPQGIH